eukprot:1805953-Pyramimonas_sp.AAC.1
MKQDVHINCSSKYGDALFECALQKARGSQAHRALLVAQPAVQVEQTAQVEKTVQVEDDGAGPGDGAVREEEDTGAGRGGEARA